MTTGSGFRKGLSAKLSLKRSLGGLLGAVVFGVGGMNAWISPPEETTASNVAGLLGLFGLLFALATPLALVLVLWPDEGGPRRLGLILVAYALLGVLTLAVGTVVDMAVGLVFLDAVGGGFLIGTFVPRAYDRLAGPAL